MIKLVKLAAVVVLGAAMSACAASGPRALSKERFERAVARAPGAAQPGRIVARELEFARAAKQEGQWTALQSFAAPGAVIHRPSGPVAAASWLAERKDPLEAVRWTPRAVWMSCDGGTAVSNGRVIDTAGQTGSFVTVWKRQTSGEYLWVYMAAVRDDPQPPARPDSPNAMDDNEIVVSALSSIKGLVADCARRGEPRIAPPPLSIAEDARSNVELSPDASLRWRWEESREGVGRFVAEYLTSGSWRVALDQKLGKAAGTGTARR